MFIPKNQDLVADGLIATAMASTINGPAININLYQDFSFFAKWSSTPTGTFKLQSSNDLGDTVTDWEDIPGSSVAVAGAAGQQMWNYTRSQFRWVRLVYTATSGSGTLSKCIFNAKGV